MTSFSNLLGEVRACTICEPNLLHGVRPVLQIDPKARILIAGQAPGRVVHESGVPFEDASGNRLREWLGVSRETFYNPEKMLERAGEYGYDRAQLPPPEMSTEWACATK